MTSSVSENLIGICEKWARLSEGNILRALALTTMMPQMHLVTQQYRMQTYDVESHRVIAWRAPLHLRLGTGTTTGVAEHAGVCGSDHYYRRISRYRLGCNPDG